MFVFSSIGFSLPDAPNAPAARNILFRRVLRLVRLLLFWFLYVDCVNKAFALREWAMRFWQKPDAIHGQTLQGTAQSVQTFSRDHDEAFLKLDTKRLVTGICDELGVLEVPIREQVDLAGFLNSEAMGVGICAPRSQIL